MTKMATSEHGALENPTKSAFSIEYYDSTWELEHMKRLEADDTVDKWTKNHGIRIPYFDEDGKFRSFSPDFLVQKKDRSIELHEMKGTHMLNLPVTKRKVEAAKEWCKSRKMEFKLISKY